MSWFNIEIPFLRKVSAADVGFEVSLITIGAYVVAELLEITLPVWVHWAMGLVLALLLITGENMKDYKNIQRRAKKIPYRNGTGKIKNFLIYTYYNRK